MEGRMQKENYGMFMPQTNNHKSSNIFMARLHAYYGALGQDVQAHEKNKFMTDLNKLICKFAEHARKN